MSHPAPNHTPHTHASDASDDVVESIVSKMPIVLPVVGGVLMLLLASIAVLLA